MLHKNVLWKNAKENGVEPNNYVVNIKVRTGMDVTVHHVRKLLKLMPYKNVTLKTPRKSKVYTNNLEKTVEWYKCNKDKTWVETDEM